MITFFGVICEQISRSSLTATSDSIVTSKELSSDTKKESYASLIMGWATALSEFQYRRTLESWYVILKADLDISGTLRQTRSNLLNHLQDNTIFSTEFTIFFSANPIQALDTDPDQIVKIKKILIALQRLEEAIDGVVNVNFNPDRNIIALHYELIPKLCSLAYTLITEIAAIHQGAKDVEMMVGAYVNPLLLKLNAMLEPLDTKNLSLPTIGQAINLFPKSTTNPNQGLENFSALIYQLPHYFQELQSLIDPESLQQLAQDNPEKIKIKIHTLLNKLKNIAQKEGLALLPSSISTIKLLLEQLPTLLDTSGHFTKKSHEKIELLLNQLRHEHLPEIIAELENMEEIFSLRPNLLVGPTLKAMNNFYNGLSSLSKHWVTTSHFINETKKQVNKPQTKVIRGLFGNITPVNLQTSSLKIAHEINVLCDDTFIKVVENHRIKRWMEADFIQKNTDIITAAERFFKKASECHHLYEGTWTVVDLLTDRVKKIPKEETINELRKDYKIFQPYYARLYPELDSLFINDFPLWLERFNHRESCVKLIRQTMEQARFKQHLLEINSPLHSQLYRPEKKAVNFSPPPVSHVPKTDREVGKLTPLGNQTAYIPPLYRALANKPSLQLQHFVEGNLKAWCKKNLDPNTFSTLSFDMDTMITSTLVDDTIQSYQYLPSCFLYKKLLCSLALIQKDLIKLEKLNENQFHSTQVLTTLITDTAPWLNICYATHLIQSSILSPELQGVLKNGLECLESLKSIPVLGEYLNSLQAQLNPPYYPEITPNIDIISCWKQQTELLTQTLTGQPVAVSVSTNTSSPQRPGSITNVESNLSCGGSSALTGNTDLVEKEEIEIQIAKSLYQLPHLIRKTNPNIKESNDISKDALNEKVSTLISAIKISNCNVGTLKKISSSINELNNTLRDIGEETKYALIAIANKLRMETILSADETEFHLSYKPGALSAPLNKILNALFNELIIDLPISSEEKMLFIEDPSLWDKRIEIEKKRLNKLPTQYGKKLNKMNHDILSGYQELRHLKKTMHDHSENYTIENKKAFLRAYQALQPYLYKIKRTYDTELFLRELQTPGDFNKAFNDLQEMKGKVFLLIEQEKKEFSDKNRRNLERIEFLENSKKSQDKNIMKTKQEFQVNLILNSAFEKGNNKLNLETKSIVSKNEDPIKRMFYLVVNLLNMEKNKSKTNEDIIKTFNTTKEKWNADCARRVHKFIFNPRHSSKEMNMEAIIHTEVNELYADYFQLIDMHQQLDIMLEYIKHHPSTSITIDQDKIHWINLLKKSLSKHDVSPKQRLINVAIIGLGNECKTALEKKSDHFLTRLLHKLYKIFLNFDTPEKKSRLLLQKKFEVFKNEGRNNKTDANKAPPSGG